MEIMQLIYRTVLMFAIVIVSMRLMGKRQMGELELNELVVAVMISELAAVPIVEKDVHLMHGIVPVLSLLACELLIAFFSMKSIRFRSLASGKPSIIIREGQIVQKEMRKNRFTVDELTEELRKQGITDLAKIHYAILETNGSLNTVLYAAHSPVTCNDLNLLPEDPGLPVIVINDGRVLKNNLSLLGLNEAWLEKELTAREVDSPKDIFILSVDESQHIYIARKG